MEERRRSSREVDAPAEDRLAAAEENRPELVSFAAMAESVVERRSDASVGGECELLGRR